MYKRSMRKKHVPITPYWCLDSSGERVGNDDDDENDDDDDDDNNNNNNNSNNNDDNNNNNNNNRLCNSLCHIAYINFNLHVTQFVTFLLHAFCDLSDCLNCTRTIMYVTIVDAHWNRENNTAFSIRTYGLLKCRYIYLTERAQNIIIVSQLYATIHIFKVALVYRVI